eukprot:11198792-Lingulodinium_polyedra.AAC.1
MDPTWTTRMRDRVPEKQFWTPNGGGRGAGGVGGPELAFGFLGPYRTFWPSTWGPLFVWDPLALLAPCGTLPTLG